MEEEYVGSFSRVAWKYMIPFDVYLLTSGLWLAEMEIF